MSTQPAGLFCLCCFWQAVKHLWSLHVSGIPPHMDLHPGRKVYLISWFIVSVLFLTGGETSMVLHMSRIPGYMHLHPDRNVYLTSWFILSVLFFDRREDVCGPYMCLGSAVTWTSTPVGTSTQPASSFCLYCFWQAVWCLWSLYMSGIPFHTNVHPDRNVCLTSWFILSVFFLTGGETSVVPACVRNPPSHRSPPHRNVNPKSWFILSVLFLIGGETSVVPTHVWDPQSCGPSLQ